MSLPVPFAPGFAAATLLLVLITIPASAARSSPNLIIALADDVSANEFRWLNDGAQPVNGAKTPNLRKMAKDGVAFRTGWSMPICGPTRGSLVTGLYAQYTGWFDNPGKPGGEENSLGIKFGTFAHVAQREGYKVLIAGKWQMVGSVTPYGYDEACLWRESDDPDVPRRDLFGKFRGPVGADGRESRYWHPMIITNGSIIPTDENDFGPNVILDCVQNFIRRQIRANEKFLVYMPLLLPHHGYDFDRREVGWIPVPIVNKNGKIIGKESGIGTMRRNLEYQDYLMGVLLKFLKKMRIHRDTVTFYIGDNGTHGNGKGSVVSEAGTRVPFIVHGPSRVKKRFLSNQLVCTNDIFNTVRGLLGARQYRQPRPNSIDFSPYLLGEANAVKRKWLYAYRGDARIIRNKNYILDGTDQLFYCPTRDERSCRLRNPGQRTEREIKLVARFRQIICRIERKKRVNANKVKQRNSGSCKRQRA